MKKMKMLNARLLRAVTHFMRVSVGIILMSLLSTAIFAAQWFPAQCKVSGLRYEKGGVVLFSQHTAKPRLYAIHNISKQAIWVTKKSDARGMGAGWDSQISSNRWSAVLITKPNFAFTCHVKDGPRKLSCKSILQICEFSHFYSKNPINGGYWVAENMSLRALMTRIRARGFEV